LAFASCSRNRDASCPHCLPMQCKLLCLMQKLESMFPVLKAKADKSALLLKSALGTYPGYRYPYTSFVGSILSGLQHGDGVCT